MSGASYEQYLEASCPVLSMLIRRCLLGVLLHERTLSNPYHLQ